MTPDQLAHAQKVNEARLQVARAALAWGVRIIEANTGPLVYRKQVAIGKEDGGGCRIVTFSLPGMLQVHDSRTGVLLAASAPGDPLKLAEDFQPAQRDNGGTL